MPIVVVYTALATPDQYDEVVSRIRFHDEPPPGLIVHTASVGGDGRMCIVDVWESQGDCDRFVEERLRPALREALGQDFAETLVEEVHDLHSMVRPVGRFRRGERAPDEAGNGTHRDA
jgi:hypothetical protein